MSAQFVDALLGYEYFLSKRGKVSLDDLNEYLVKNNRRQIQLRTYTHYHKLLKNGFRSYIPINKFDVFQSLGKLQMAADRRRFSRDENVLSAKITRNGKKWIQCNIIDRSLVGFGIVTSERFPISKGKQIWCRLDGYSDIPLIVVWKKHFENSTRLGTRAFEYIAEYRISDQALEKSRLKGNIDISQGNQDDILWQDIFDKLSKTDEMIHAITDLIYSVDEFVGSDIKVATPILIKIVYKSPGEAQIKVDFGIAEIARLIIEKIQFWGLEKRKYLAEVRQIELENENREIEIKKANIELEQLQLEGVRNAIKTNEELGRHLLGQKTMLDLRLILRRIIGIAKLPEHTFEEDSIEYGILVNRIIPVITELVAGDDPDFNIEATIDSDSEN